MNLFIKISLVYFSILLLWCPVAIAQQDASKLVIDDIAINRETGFIELDVIACSDLGESLFPIGTDGQLSKVGLRVDMLARNGTYDPLPVYKIKPISLSEDGTKLLGTEQKSEMKIHFLLDLSGSMKGVKLEQAKDAIKSVISFSSLEGVKKEFSWFHNDIGVTRSLRKDNLKDVVDRVEASTLDTDLYRALREKLEELKSFEGDKILILLTDGKNDIRRNPNYKGTLAFTPIEEDGILNYISTLDSTFQIYPVGIGDDASESFLKAVAESTISTEDSYSFGVAPQDIKQTFKTIMDCLTPNFTILCRPKKGDTFGTERYTFNINYESKDMKSYRATKSAVLGSSGKIVDPYARNINTSKFFFIGILLLGLVLGLLSLLVPIYNNYLFRKEYVRKYGDIKVDNVQKFDPFIQEPFKDDDEVVVKRNKMLLLDSWKYCVQNENTGAEYSEFAELFQFGTSGNFFQQKGPFLKLNWLWYGMLGGLLGWGLNEVLSNFEVDTIKSLFSIFDTDELKLSSAVLAETKIGFALGFCLLLTLTIVEELGPTRKFNILNVILRSLLGGIIGTVLFFCEGLFVAKFLSYRYLGSLFGWVLFGTILGLSLSAFSSIEAKNGAKGGLIAGLIAFHFYFFLNLEWIAAYLNPEMSRLFSYMIYGSILGLIIRVVVSRLEDFELLILSPKAFSGRVSPISKWLKSSSIDYVFMGKDPGCHLYIKWDDPIAKRRHAKFSYSNNVVSVEPEDGAIYVNNICIQKRTSLKNDDIISLGAKSTSRVQFRTKETTEDAQIGSLGGNKHHGSSIHVKRRSKKEVANIRGQITIRKRVK